MPNRVKTVSTICISSTSLSNESEPTISASHWKNSLYLPFCGLSALHTGCIWYRLKGNCNSSLCITTYLAKGTVRSYRSPFSHILAANRCGLSLMSSSWTLLMKSPELSTLKRSLSPSSPYFPIRVLSVSMAGVSICWNPYSAYTSLIVLNI